MKCAACNEPMIVAEYEGIELDYCPTCSGVWFDAGEIELLMDKMQVESSGLDALHLHPEASSKEEKRKCPVCGKRMRKVKLGHEPEIVIDVCPQGEGLWFDEGEVGHLVGHLAAQSPDDIDSQERVLSFLGDVFNVRG